MPHSSRAQYLSTANNSYPSPNQRQEEARDKKKTLSSALSFPLAAIINKSIMHGALPAEWKEARVCPIPKKGQSTDPADYRPVSILPAVSLIAEKHMMRFLGPAVEVGLPENQYGFRKGRGCEDALIRLESEICAGWEMCRVQKPRVATKVAVVAIDMSKAFDKIPHCQLMRSLRQRFELPPCVDRWYCDFVTGRTMWVQVGQGKSDKIPILSGIPQGSVSGPVLFNAATAELGDVVLSQNTTRIAYADDWTIVKPILTQGCLNDLQSDVGKMFGVIEGTGNVVNPAKTDLLIATLSKVPTQHPLSITVAGTTITAKPEIKILGVTWDTGLTFTSHIRSKTKAARRMLGHVTGSLRRWCVPGAITHIYNSCIRPAMIYASTLTFGVNTAGDDAYDRVDRLTSRIVGGGSLARRAPFCASGSRLAAETKESRTRLIELYAHGRRYAPPGIRECVVGPRTVKTRSMDDTFKLEQPYASTLTRVSKCCLCRGVASFNDLPAERRGVRSGAQVGFP